MLPFADQFVHQKAEFLAAVRPTFSPQGKYQSYIDLVRTAIEVCEFDDHGRTLDPKIECLNWGDYQGTLVLVLAEKCYQPSTHYITTVYYGSCSGCDTLEAIFDDKEHPEQQAEDLFSLTLHMFQRMQRIEC